MSKNNNLYLDCTPVIKRSGCLIVEKRDIPSDVDYPKRFAARAIASRLGISEAKIYNHPNFYKNTNSKGVQSYCYQQ